MVDIVIKTTISFKTSVKHTFFVNKKIQFSREDQPLTCAEDRAKERKYEKNEKRSIGIF